MEVLRAIETFVNENEGMILLGIIIFSCVYALWAPLTEKERRMIESMRKKDGR
jgi:hypothetical protein